MKVAGWFDLCRRAVQRSVGSFCASTGVARGPWSARAPRRLEYVRRSNTSRHSYGAVGHTADFNVTAHAPRRVGCALRRCRVCRCLIRRGTAQGRRRGGRSGGGSGCSFNSVVYRRIKCGQWSGGMTVHSVMRERPTNHALIIFRRLQTYMTDMSFYISSCCICG